MKPANAMKKLSLFALAVVAICGVIFGHNRLTDGFSIREMTSSLPASTDGAAVALSEVRRAEIRGICNQTFRYIGKGCQFYVFASEDGKYVIKFFKHKHLRPLTWLRQLPLPAKWQPWSEEKIAKREERVRCLFGSIQLAYDELAEETGIFYLHLHRVPVVEQKLTLVDKLGIKHHVNVDDFEFLLQKKAIPLVQAFAEVRDGEEARAKIKQLVELISRRCEKGIRDRDRSFAQNVAFCADEPRAVFIDVGQFYCDGTAIAPEEREKDFRCRLGNLRHWMETHYPQFVPQVDEELR